MDYKHRIESLLYGPGKSELSNLRDPPSIGEIQQTTVLGEIGFFPPMESASQQMNNKRKCCKFMTTTSH